MMLRSFLAVLALGAVLSQPVCAQTAASKVDYNGTPRYLQVSGIMARDVNGLLNLAIEIANSDNSDRTGYYRLSWTDEQGFPVWDEEPWKPVLLHGEQRRKFMVVAPTPRARDFRIEFSDDSNWSGKVSAPPMQGNQ